MKHHILLLEDDPNLGFVLQEHLESNAFAVTLRTNGEDGIHETRRHRFDLYLVDVMMPKKDGFTFARELRQSDSKTPLIFLTAKALKEDRVEGLSIGGDDYVTKPFSMEELLLRIKAVLRRAQSHAIVDEEQSIHAIGSLTFDPAWQTLSGKTKKQKLTARESHLLRLLCERQNTLVSRSEILKEVWGDDTYFNGRSLDVFISKLRKLLAAETGVEIKSVHGKGYKLVSRTRKRSGRKTRVR